MTRPDLAHWDRRLSRCVICGSWCVDRGCQTCLSVPALAVRRYEVLIGVRP